jgi:hypothetical protein
LRPGDLPCRILYILGIKEIHGLDLRPLGNVAVAVALVPPPYWQVFSGGWTFRSVLAVWMIAFLSVGATTYGKLNSKLLGAILIGTAIYTFWLPAWILATGNTIP